MEDQNDHTQIYTLGMWKVKPEMADEFIREWTGFANKTGKQFPEAGKAYLLRDSKDPLSFISFGPWPNENTIQEWRDSNDFRSFVLVVKRLCSDFQPNTLKIVSKSE